MWSKCPNAVFKVLFEGHTFFPDRIFVFDTVFALRDFILKVAVFQRWDNFRSYREFFGTFSRTCGETGGELESFVLDAPMYKRAISIDKSDVVTHSDDFDAPGKSIFRQNPIFSKNFAKILKIPQSFHF